MDALALSGCAGPQACGHGMSIYTLTRVSISHFLCDAHTVVRDNMYLRFSGDVSMIAEDMNIH